MSTTLSLQMPEPPVHGPLIAGVALPDLRCLEPELEEDQPWPEGRATPYDALDGAALYFA